MFSGCDDKESQPEIKVENEASLLQTVYADETNGKSGVTIVTSGAWSSSITEGSAKSTKSGTVSWLSIAPSSGATAGTHTIVISLEANASGADRTATITITCNETDITITVTQKATKEDGKPYELPPVLTTAAVSNITATTATVGGNITNAGTPPYTERGVCYAIAANPTIDGNKVTAAGDDTGDFTAELTGLTAETKYYVRAYATGSAGTVYGNQLEFTTEAVFCEVSHNFVKREGTTIYDNNYVVKVNGIQKNFTIEVNRYAERVDFPVTQSIGIYMDDLSMDDVELFQEKREFDNWVEIEIPGIYYAQSRYVVNFIVINPNSPPNIVTRFTLFEGYYYRIIYRMVEDANEKIDLTYYTWEFEKIGITYGTAREVDDRGITYNARTADFKYRVKFGTETFDITIPFDVFVRK